MITFTEENTVKRPILEELQKLGWKYIPPSEMNKIRDNNFENPIVTNILIEAIKKINRDVKLKNEDIELILRKLNEVSLSIEGIKTFLNYLRNGIGLKIENEKKEVKNVVVRLIDFENIENNIFVVTDEFRVNRLEHSYDSIRADIILLVNGIPLVIIECKNPTLESGWLDAYKQIKEYEVKTPQLFVYVQFSIVTDGLNTYYFSNAFRNEKEEKNYIFVWKDPYPFRKEDFKNDILKITIYGLLSKQNLLDIIENFIFIKKERDRYVKIMARYMQFRAANKIFKRVIDTLEGRDDKKFGLIWHWQGSGKTYTMAFAARKIFLHRTTKHPTIFIIVDRKDLEEQIYKEFSSLLDIYIHKVESIKELYEILKEWKEGRRGIFITTIEKFSYKEFEKFEKERGKIDLSRENIVVLADEVHRTHYGIFASVMRSILKNAFIFGFTGTPLSKEERNTFQKFCPQGELYLDRYSMLESIQDGFTVPISYEPRLGEYHLNEREIKELMKFDELLEEEEKKEIKKRLRPLKEILKRPERIKKISKDIADHFREIVEPTGFKAMIVAVDREACVMYKEELDKILPPEYSEVVMTFSDRESNKKIEEYVQKLKAKYGNKDIKDIVQEIIDNFKYKEYPKILIVTDMLITGFDAPILQVMYLDKVLKEHRVLQTIARTNRPYSDIKKFGLIIDYVGIMKEIEEAFQKFEAKDAEEIRLVIRKLDFEREEFKKLLEEALEIFKDVNKDGSIKSLNQALDILVDPQKAKKFENLMKSLIRSYELLSGDPFLRDYIGEYKWLVSLYIVYNKVFKKIGIDEIKIRELLNKTKELIRRSIDLEKIEDSYPTLSIDEEFIEKVKEMIKSKNVNRAAAIDVLKNIEVEARKHTSSLFFYSLLDDIKKAHQELIDRKTTTEEVLAKALEISDKIMKRKEEENEIGRDIFPIYENLRILIPEIRKEEAIEKCKELIEKLKKEQLLFKDWYSRVSILNRVKEEVVLWLLNVISSLPSTEMQKYMEDETMSKMVEIIIKSLIEINLDE